MPIIMTLWLRPVTSPHMNAFSSSILLSGGLGNQLFQYCFARRIAEEIQVPVLLDSTILSLSHKTSNCKPTIEELRIGSVGFTDNSSQLNRLLSRQIMGFSNYLIKQYMREILDQAVRNSVKTFKQNK